MAERKVDQAALKVNQTLIITLLVLAFIFDMVWLAALNLFLGFCAGCFVYYQLNRLGVPGFTGSPLL